MTELITKLSLDDAFAELQKTTRVFFCGPGITKEIGKILLQLAQENINRVLYIVCDLDAQNDYRGLNEIEELNNLFRLSNIQMKRSKGINVSFISNMSDFNYCLFPVSKILKSDPDGYNAILINGLTALGLFANFFPEVVVKSPDTFLKIVNLQKDIELTLLNEEDATIKDFLEKKINVESISENEIEVIQKKVRNFHLKRNLICSV